MKEFLLTGSIQISVYTTVEAESLEEAIEIANDRDLCTIAPIAGHKESEWMCDELDGEVYNIVQN